MEYVEYIDKNEYVILYRMHAPGSIAEIPSVVAGKPVRMLADHLFAEKPSVLWNSSQIRREPEGADRQEKALCGSSLEVIRIPEGVEAVGNYAFYGCYNLREVSFPSSLSRIGYGMFNGCRIVRRLQFELGAGVSGAGDAWQNPPVMKEILDAVTNEIEAVATQDGRELWRLTFPDYYEEGKENTPARIIEIVYHGTGRQYRNCFLNRKLQFDRYDEIFPLAAAQEGTDTCLSIILNRLRRGPSPEKEWTDRYIDYLRSEHEALIRRILDDREFDPVSELEMLDRDNYFTSNIIDAFIRHASSRKRSDAVSYLMDIKHRRFRTGGRSKYIL